MRELKDCQGKAAGRSIFNTPWVAQLIFFAAASAEFMGCSFPFALSEGPATKTFHVTRDAVLGDRATIKYYLGNQI